MEKLYKKSDAKENIGTQACELVIGFLELDNHGYQISVYTFTELFAFVFFEIDNILFIRNIPTRDVISQSLLKMYWNILNEIDEIDEKEKYHLILDQRIDEYASMLRSHKDKSDIVEKLDFYINQASGLNDFHTEESPFILTDAFVNLSNRLALTSFYTDTLVPFVEKIITIK